MNLTDAAQQADFRAALADFGEPITWEQSGSTALTAIIADEPIDRVPADRGQTPLIDKTFHALIDDLPAGYDPTAATITHDGNTYDPQNTTTDNIVATFQCRQIS